MVTWTYDPAPRHRSYELLAEAFGLGEAESPVLEVAPPFFFKLRHQGGVD